MTDSYVLLTGSKNNSGDYLIKHRAIALLRWLRPDRELIDVDAWKPLSDESLAAVNDARAVILTGGPALQEHMYPQIYALRRELREIKPPILTMGIGWRGLPGSWKDTRSYKLSQATLDLLRRVEKSGYQSSVRDYHTLNVLRHHGLGNFLMTGCPALYVREHLGADGGAPPVTGGVSFSVGVAFLTSRAMERQMQNVLSMLAERFDRKNVTAVFHHSTNQRFFDRPDSTTRQQFGRKRFLRGHERFMAWLEKMQLGRTDVSGDADSMIRHYSDCRLHVGYRVHAHILMSSLSRPSVLLAEDGRARALREVIGGPILDGYDDACNSAICRLLKRWRLIEPFNAYDQLHSEVEYCIEQEEREANSRARKTRAAIDVGFGTMRRFVAQLP